MHEHESQPELTASSIAEMDQASWQRIKARLQFMHGEATYNSWMRALEVIEVSPHEITLSIPTMFMRDWVLSHYADDILACWQAEKPEILRVHIKIRKQESTAHRIAATHSIADQNIVAAQGNDTTNYAPPHSPNLHTPAPRTATLDPRFTFEHFIVGKNNHLAHAAALRIAGNQTLCAGGNPLYLYGGVGLGKTHLLQAIAWHIRTHQPSRKVLYLSAEQFMHQFIHALRQKNLTEFKSSFRSVDVLMIDDIQFICGKNSTQEEFFHTFNALIENGKQIVLSADRPPSDLDATDERMRSRLGWGLVADIEAADHTLRHDILKKKVKDYPVDVPEDVLHFLAEKVTSNIRELEGALNKITAHAELVKQDITLSSTQKLLKDLLRSVGKDISLAAIQKTVASYYTVSINDMRSSRRARHIARPRQMAIFLAKQLTKHSLPEIGRAFGGKDHATVLHAVKRIHHLTEEDHALKHDMETLCRMLQEN